MAGQQKQRALTEAERALIKRLSDQAGAEGAFNTRDISELYSFIQDNPDSCNHFYIGGWAGFGEVDDSTWEGAFFDDLVHGADGCIEEYEDYSLLDQATGAIRGYLEDSFSRMVHLTEINDHDGQRAWLVIRAKMISPGEAEEEVIALTKTRDEAKAWLRANGFCFVDQNPSGESPDHIEKLARALLQALDF